MACLACLCEARWSSLPAGALPLAGARRILETVSRHLVGEVDKARIAPDSEFQRQVVRCGFERDGEHFPHVRRALRLDDVPWVSPLPLVRRGRLLAEEIASFVNWYARNSPHSSTTSAIFWSGS